LVIENAYAELDLAPGASEAEVKAAWRRLVSQWHPDRNKTASALVRMQRINTAYETDPARGVRARLAGGERHGGYATRTRTRPRREAVRSDAASGSRWKRRRWVAPRCFAAT